MNDAALLSMPLGIGCLTGFIFYGGLLWTTRRGLLSPRPALWFFCSFWLRMAVVLSGFYMVAGSDWKKLLACLTGLLMARMAVTQVARKVLHAD